MKDSLSVGFCVVCVSVTFSPCRYGSMPKGGFEPPIADDTTRHACDISTTQRIQYQTLGESSPITPVQKDALSERPQHICLRREYGICMGEFSDDLATVVAAWESVPAAVKAGIVAMVTVARQP